VFTLPGDNDRGAQWSSTSCSCTLFCRFNKCDRNSLFDKGLPREWKETKREAQLIELKKSKNYNTKLDTQKTGGISPSGIYNLDKRPELNVHRDTAFGVLHTSKQGI